MIVELIGPSGAGKTTIGRLLLEHPAIPRPAAHTTDLIEDRPFVRHVRDPRLANVAADLTVLPSFLAGLPRDREFVRFAFDRLARTSRSRLFALNYRREVVRNVGRHELARRSGRRTTIVDEGAVLTAYHLFVYAEGQLEETELDTFARLVPKPDRLVYVGAPVETLVERAMRRPDRRRELATAGAAEAGRWMARAIEVFERLTSSPELRDRTIAVSNDGDPSEALERIVAFLVDADDPAAGRPTPPEGPDRAALSEPGG